MTETNIEAARRGFEAALAGNFEAIAALLDTDVKWHGGDPTAVGSCQNRGQALEFMRRAREHGGLGELVDVVGAGDKVVVIMRPPRRGGRQPPLVANLTTFRDGKVIEMVHYPDPEVALAAARGKDI
ncbi:MAG TPA: nuclear transport factor 2 family protein [Solirubrobacteraceae bacterium]|jgi:ketosteroid isomerase-like protein|nr:nuclear transport factor 2 family protein [Solirubrobacteraceae bacterium]